MLSESQVAQFVHDGFVKIENAFPSALAAEACDILWRDLALDPLRPETWARPVIRLGMYSAPPFVQAANTPMLHAAFDQLVGVGRWQPCMSVGTFPVRFPSQDDPGDTGWHVDVSFGFDSPDFMSWRVNVSSKGRALLMLFLFSDVGGDDAPTLVRAGSHLDIARQLAPAGEAGLTLGELVADGFKGSHGRPEAAVTGAAGTVYLCHPFLVHRAQTHKGVRPRFMAQPPLLPRSAYAAQPAAMDSPVARAIQAGM